MKETAIRLIQEIPDDKIVYILHIIKGLNGLYEEGAADQTRKQTSYSRLQRMRGRIPDDLNYADELALSRMERYENIN
jgi:hypothetical protein